MLLDGSSDVRRSEFFFISTILQKLLLLCLLDVADMERETNVKNWSEKHFLFLSDVYYVYQTLGGNAFHPHFITAISLSESRGLFFQPASSDIAAYRFIFLFWKLSAISRKIVNQQAIPFRQQVLNLI